MKAVQYETHGGYEVLHLAEVPEPVRNPGDVLIEVRAAAVNVGDNTLRLGHFPGSKLPLVPGFEGMGRVMDPGDSDLPRGTRVMFTGLLGIMEDGTWRERISFPAQQCIRVPDALSDVEAGAFPIAYLTAYLALKKGGFAPGKRVLIPAVGGAVGNAGIQIARFQGAAQIMTTAGSSAKAEKAKDLGYDHVIDLSRESLRERVMEITGGKGVDVILDGIGGALTATALSTLAGNGVHVIYGAVAGAMSQINVFDLIMRGASMTGFAALIEQPAEDIAQAYRDLIPMVEKGGIRTVVSKVFAFEEAAEAQRFLIEDRPFGKVMLCPAPK